MPREAVLPPAEAALRRRGPPPRLAVGLELARLIRDWLLVPPRLFDFLACRESLRAELEGDLESAAPVVEVPSSIRLPARPLRLFVSCAEASGELHAGNLVDSANALADRQGAPRPRWSGLGGEALERRGVQRLGDPVARASMAFDGYFSGLPYYLGLLEKVARTLREEPFDALVAVDSPALHVPLGHLAHRYGVPVVHFVAPQMWGWAPWRASDYRTAVDRVLGILPFESAWFGRRGIDLAHVGHPLLDELAQVPSTRPPESGPLVLLPGSRATVIDRNLPWMLAVAGRLREERPGLEVVIPHGDGAHAERLEGHLRAAGAGSWARPEIGDLHGTLARARAALSVSGTVLLDLLHHRLPTVVVYRMGGARGVWAYEHLLSAPWFASINLLAGREVVPEFCFAGEGPRAEATAALERCLDDGPWRRRCLDGLDLAARRLGPPGACQRAAGQLLELAGARALADPVGASNGGPA